MIILFVCSSSGSEHWPGPPSPVSPQPCHGDEVYHQYEQPQCYDVTEPAHYHQPVPAQRPARPQHDGAEHCPHLTLSAR